MIVGEHIEIEDKKFVKYISDRVIQDKVRECAEKINEKFEKSTQIPIILSLLNGATFFTVDLCKNLSFLCKIDYIKYVSYSGMESTNKLTDLIGLKNDLSGEDVILVDDIIDSGYTMSSVVEIVKASNPRSITIVTCIFKPNACKNLLKVDFYAIEMLDDSFVVGYGLDYNEVGRTLKNIYILE